MLYLSAFLGRYSGMASRSATASEPIYGAVEIYNEKILGIGSYGKVCRAKYGQLPCAAKILHDTMFDSETSDPGIQKFVQRFEQECQFLKMIRHPNVILYLGTSRDPQSGRLTLLMELMDESLTKFLERSTIPLPYHTQLNICHDVALALAYLHSNDIIHRDLSSNNVLLIGEGSRAKVTDFGVSKLTDLNPRMTPLTMCPGTAAYMPPEALITPPQYSKKLDCFSYGVLTIQIASRKFPNPGDAHKYEVTKDPKSNMTRRSLHQIPESERRKKDVDAVDPHHPLLPLALHCLKDFDTERPSADELCTTLTSLKQKPRYAQSVEQISILGLQQDLEKRDQAIVDCNAMYQEKSIELEEALAEVKRTREAFQNELDMALANAEKESERRLNAMDSSIKQLLEESRTLLAAKRTKQETSTRLLRAEMEKKARLKQRLKASKAREEHYKKRLAEVNATLLALVEKDSVEILNGNSDVGISSSESDQSSNSSSEEFDELLENFKRLETLASSLKETEGLPKQAVHEKGLACEGRVVTKAPHYSLQKTDIHTSLQHLKKGDPCYLVDIGWMKQWKKYVGYDQWDQSMAGQASARPGPVDNSNLFKDGVLRERLMEEIDYFLLPEPAWTKLTSWYGTSQGSRPIPHCDSQTLELKLCLYSKQTEVVVKHFNKACSVVELKEQLKETFAVAKETKCQVWHRYEYIKTIDELLSNSTQTLGDASLYVYSGQIMMLELRNEDGTWPSDAKSPQSVTEPHPRSQSFALKWRKKRKHGDK